MARLVRIKGPLDGEAFPIEGGVTIGRGPHNSIPLPKCRKSSRDHCKLWEIAPGKYAVADLGSTNGTLVNDARVPRADLSDGDHVQVGEVIFRFELDESERPKPKIKPSSNKRDDFAAILRGEQPRPDKPVAASLEGHAAIEIKQRLLQYQKKSSKGSQLGWDLTQTAGPVRYVLIALAIAVTIGLFLLVKTVAGG